MAKASLGIRRLHSIEISVRDAQPWLAYWTDGFGFQHTASGSAASVEAGGARRHVLRCRDVCIVLRERVRAGSSVDGFLERHREGISALNFQVDDLRAIEERLLERNATPTGAVQTERTDDGHWRRLAIATPLGDVEFGFVESADDRVVWPGTESLGAFDPDRNPIGLSGVDHLIANMRTMMPAIAFFEHVMGLTRHWDVQFHAEDIRPGVGSGLRSIVMWDEAAGVRIMNNEPLRPRFNESQVQATVDDNRGPGIQHIALAVKDVESACEHLNAGGIQRMPVPTAYYEALPRRIAALGLKSVEPSVEAMRRLGILFDGDSNGCLLQAICRDQATQFKRPNAGPVFVELIERRGCRGFGEGNSRALFEAAQKA